MPKIIPIIDEKQQQKSSPSTGQAWLALARFFSLPLSFSGVSLGNAWAHQIGIFSWRVCILSLLTSTCLHLLTNIANDYGDAVHQTDEKRLQWLLSQNKLTLKHLRWIIYALTILSIVFGLALIFSSSPASPMMLLILGALAIFAAITYTVGKNPYGYRGFGDFSVFLFFGLLAVLGSFYAQTGTVQVALLLPAVSMGLWCVAVLNINNMRDIKTDLLAHKYTLAAKLGAKKARYYHLILLLIALFSWNIFTLKHHQWLNAVIALIFTLSHTHLIHLCAYQPKHYTFALKWMTFSIAATVFLFIIR